MEAWFYTISEGVLSIASVLLLLGAAEVGVLLARWPRSRHLGNPDRFLYTLATPLLGLLALMLGFSFGLSLSSHEARIMEVVDEANAIETAALRGRMLQEPYASEVESLLKQYTILRIAHSKEIVNSPAMITAVNNSLEIREKLWRVTMTAEAANPQLPATTMFVEALNNMIDIFAKRLAAERNHVPAPIFFMLQTIAMMAIGFSSYGAQLGGTYSRAAMWILAATFGLIITLIFDLDNGRSGLITVSQQPLLDLLATMK
jgi:hypothetical protein